MLTNGDGGCGLHGVWGHPSAQQQWLELAYGQALARAYLRDVLPPSSALAHFLCSVFVIPIRETSREYVSRISMIGVCHSDPRDI